ncbi:MAP7 domain-containing protein 2a isoform X2 [Thalassophryne amazonica]|uniref:MAP7 domain-containing protein 2a isoform X2 n=1 Tax=Thalassophryne amazonica TaxID=390379 RepID=UPI001471A4C0|nr:MAP7 domain-containing protein 2a isoform X2 [Thalassophryne amazonica]
MAKTISTSNTITGEKTSPPPICLLPDKKSQSNTHSSPARAAKTVSTNTEKKLQINGQPSPSHVPANISNNHAGKPIVEGYLKTDDRMRLAKERREERERSLAAREQQIREKERRAQLQYERTVEERWRRLEEQRQKEDLRRAAVEEKRRQKLEEERERLEALMKRSLERSLQLEQRPKWWNRGYPTGAGDSENAPSPFSAASPLPAAIESAPCSPHRLPFCGALNSADRSRTGIQGGSQSTPNTPKKEQLRRERRTASPVCTSPLRRSESPASITKQLNLSTTSKLVSQLRSHSPSNAHQRPYSPTRRCPDLSADDKKEDKTKVDKSQSETTVKKNIDINSMHPSPADKSHKKDVVDVESSKKWPAKGETLDKRTEGNTSEKHHSPNRKELMSPKVDIVAKEMEDEEMKKESAPSGSTRKASAGTTSAEEATRLLAECRRQAQAQRELEEKRLEKEKEQMLQEEQLRKQMATGQQRHEAPAQPAKEVKKKENDPQKVKEKEEEEMHERELQLDKKREKAKVQARENTERQWQERELQKHQEEEERQQRKKRIEEIMKRTRKTDADLKEEQVEAKCVPPKGEGKMTVQTKTQVSEQVIKNVHAQVREHVAIQESAKMNAGVKKETPAQMENHKSVKIKSADQAPNLNITNKGLDIKNTNDEHRNQLSKEDRVGALKHHGVNGKATDKISKEPTANNKAKQKDSEMNGVNKDEGRTLMSDRATEVSKQQSLHIATAEGKAKALRAAVTVLSVVHPMPPVIKLEPLDVRSSVPCDDVQSMEVSPAASKEELISIPKFSPVKEVEHSSLSNARALEDLMDLTGRVAYPKLSSDGNMGDCNKNLIEGVVSPMSDSKNIGMSPPSSNKQHPIVQ